MADEAVAEEEGGTEDDQRDEYRGVRLPLRTDDGGHIADDGVQRHELERGAAEQQEHAGAGEDADPFAQRRGGQPDAGQGQAQGAGHGRRDGDRPQCRAPADLLTEQHAEGHSNDRGQTGTGTHHGQ